jgi:hypothetical protein
MARLNEVILVGAYMTFRDDFIECAIHLQGQTGYKPERKLELILVGRF